MSQKDPLKDELLGHLEPQLDNCRFELITATSIEQQDMKLAYGFLRLVHKRLTAEQEVKFDYGRFVLERRFVDNDTGLALIEELFSGTLKLPDYGLLGGVRRSSSRVEFVPTQKRHYLFRPEWPMRYLGFECDQDRRANPTFTPLLQRGSPPLFPGEVEAIKIFFQLEVGRDYGFNEWGKFVVVVPDYRARISELRIGYNEASVKMEALDLTSNQLAVKMYAEGAEQTVYSADIACPDGVAKFSFGFEAERVLAMLFRQETGEKIDQREWDLHWGDASKGVVLEMSDQKILSLISRGEGKHLEFKGVRKLDEQNKDDFLETVLAFSNTEGGLILLGVDNHGVPVGFYGDEDSVRRMIHDSCEPSVAPKFYNQKINGCLILVVEIPQGTDKPYMWRFKGVSYVRVGPNDYPASRLDMDQLTRRKNL